MGHDVQGQVSSVPTLYLSVPDAVRRAPRPGLRAGITRTHAAGGDCPGKAGRSADGRRADPKNLSGTVLLGGGPASGAQAEPALGL